MKLKKMIAGIILTIIFISQVSFIPVNSFVYAQDTVTESEGKFHYQQLTETAKSIYNGIYNMYVKGILKTGTQDYDLVENGYFTESQIEQYKKGNSELIKAMDAARYAFYADYPEIFYVNFPKLTIRTTQGADGKYHIYLGSGRYENYYINGFSNEEEVEKAIKEFDARVNEIVQNAKNLEIKEGENQQVEQMKYVHDEIINNTSYRLEDTCYEGNEGYLGTPYGILVKKQGVCEGYSRAFKTILDKLGINCILVQGVHQYSGEAAVSHMWNYVQIEDTKARQATKKWYAVDTTQDDPEIYVADEKDRINYMNNFDTYGLDGFEGMKYLLAGQLTMNERHFPNGVVEAAGDYEFEYPVLEDENFGTTEVSNADGLSVTYRPNAQVDGDSSSAEFRVSYRGMGAAKAMEQGIYMLVRYNVYNEKTDSFTVSPWCYVLPEVYALDDHEEYFNLYENQAMYMEFAATTVKSVRLSETDYDYLRYRGDDKSIIARTEKIYNENSGYLPPPYVKKQTPTQTATLDIREKPYHVTAVWDEELALSEGYTEDTIGYKIECISSIGADVTGDKYTEITNFTWNGTDTVEFDVKFSQMYADDNVDYRIYLTGLVGKNSKKAPNPVTYGASNKVECPCVQSRRGRWEIYGKPTLLESQDLSTNDWKTSTGVPVSEKLKDRITLVTTKTTKEQTEKMEELMEKAYPDQEVISSATYNITLSVCKLMVVETGHKVKVKLGFPEGYGPEDEGVTYKAYHFKRNAIGEVTGVEEIDCVVTQYGLIITCDSFSPFTIAAVKSDETETTQQSKSVIVTSSEGGIITGENIDETKIINLAENESKQISVKPDKGYEIESITVCGKEVEVTNKDAMDVTVNYEDIQNANNIVNATFVAKSVIQKEEARNEVLVQPTVTPAEITMPENIETSLKQTVKIEPTITETPGIQTYQWYKGEEKLEGKTNKVLEIKNVTKQDAGEYKLKVTSTLDTVSVDVISEPCTVTISSFTTAITKSTDKTLYPGENFEVTVNINDFENIPKGLIALGGQLEYDTNILEIVDITEQNGWDMENGFNGKSFKFIMDNDKYILENGGIFTIKFKVADNVKEATTTTIKVKNIVASNAIRDISSNDVEISVDVQKAPSTIKANPGVPYIIEEGFISRISDETTVSDFKENVTASQAITIKDADGKTLEDTDIIGTGAILQVGDDLQFTLIVIGDINGDGEITITDISKLKLHSIEAEGEMLTGASLRAADLDGNNEITITDLAQIKLAWLDKQN